MGSVPSWVRRGQVGCPAHERSGGDIADVTPQRRFLPLDQSRPGCQSLRRVGEHLLDDVDHGRESVYAADDDPAAAVAAERERLDAAPPSACGESVERRRGQFLRRRVERGGREAEGVVRGRREEDGRGGDGEVRTRDGELRLICARDESVPGAGSSAGVGRGARARESCDGPARPCRLGGRPPGRSIRVPGRRRHGPPR